MKFSGKSQINCVIGSGFFLFIISNSDGRVTMCRLTLHQIVALGSIFRVLIDRNIVETNYFYQKKEAYCRYLYFT